VSQKELLPEILIYDADSELNVGGLPEMWPWFYPVYTFPGS